MKQRSFVGAAVSCVLLLLALYFAPNTPSILEISNSPQKQNCTQKRILVEDTKNSQNRASSEVYNWSCDPEIATQYQENQQKSSPSTAIDAELLAQEKVAYWTTCIALATVLGLIALIWTLFETQKMTKATREIGEGQSRAYVGVKSAQITDIKLADDESSCTLTVSINIHNSGPTPAQTVEVRLRNDKRDQLDFTTVKNRVEKWAARHWKMYIGANSERNLIVQLILQPDIHDHGRLKILHGGAFSDNDSLVLWLDLSIAYTDCFKIRRISYWSFEINGTFLYQGYCTDGHIIDGIDTTLMDDVFNTNEEVVSTIEN